MGKIFPKSLERSPLISSTAELRLSNPISNSVLLGQIYAKLAKYGDLEALPAASMPELMRVNASFKYLPHYRVRRPDASLALQLGPSVVSLVGEPNISGADIAEVIPELTAVLADCGVLHDVERAGLRYVNFFRGQSLSGQVEIGASFQDEDISNALTNIRAEIRSNDFVVALVFASSATIQKNPLGTLAGETSNLEVGSIIDIDVSTVNLPKSGSNESQSRFVELFIGAHELAKRTFFRTLKDEVIQSLGPQ